MILLPFPSSSDIRKNLLFWWFSCKMRGHDMTGNNDHPWASNNRTSADNQRYYIKLRIKPPK